MVWLWHLEPIPRLILALCGGRGEEIRCVEGRPEKKGKARRGGGLFLIFHGPA